MPNVNKNVDLIPTQLAWRPYDIPTSGSVDFVGGLKTIMGTGDVSTSIRETCAEAYHVRPRYEKVSQS